MKSIGTFSTVYSTAYKQGTHMLWYESNNNKKWNKKLGNYIYF